MKKSKAHKGWHSRGYLPHFDAQDVFQFVSFRLHDAVPRSVVQRWRQEVRLRKPNHRNSKESDEIIRLTQEYEDRGKGSCHLRDDRIAALVQEALLRFQGDRYHVVAWCIMPNHVHILVETKKGNSLSDIVHTWKSFTALQANKILNREGRFWMPDYFDRYIRDADHFDETVQYILENPVKAGLVDSANEWPWSGDRGKMDRGHPGRSMRAGSPRSKD
ncbi:MAG: transposase [Fidelibacterota bacterium]